MASANHQSFNIHEWMTMFNYIPEPILITELNADGSMTIVGANRSAVIHSGYSRNELLRMTPEDIIDKKVWDQLNDIDLLMDKKSLKLESVHVQKDGSKIPVSVNVQLVELDNNRTIIINSYRDISDKKDIQTLLETTDQQLQSLFIYNPDIIFMLDQKGNFININPASEKILKYNSNELLQKNYTDIIHADDLERTNREFNIILNKQTVQTKLKVIDHFSQTLQLDLTAVPIIVDNEVEGVIGVARDITEEGKIKEKLQISEQRYRSLLENNIDAVLSFDLQGRFTYVNKATEQMMGYTEDELKGKPFIDYIVPEEKERTINEYNKVLNGNANQYETCMLNKQKVRVYLHVTIIPIMVEGDITGVHCIGKDITESKQFEEKLNYMAYHDYLTQLPNQYYFHSKLNETIKIAKQNNTQFSIFFIDLDRFKIINDSLGHDYGDILLKNVANRLKSFADDNASIFRYGGDEFIILAENTKQEEVTEYVKALMKLLVKPYELDGMDIVATPSIGISMYPADGKDQETLMKKADNAMYFAKRMGKSNYQFYRDSINSKITGNIGMESLLRKAIDRNEFSLFYQPQIETKTNRIYGAEALIRWHNEKLGMVSPGEFIPLAEETGLIVPIGEWVIKEACRQNIAWQNAGFNCFPVSVNLSIRQFYQTDLTETIKRIIQDSGLDPQFLELEITESMAMDSETSSVILKDLKNLGVKIAMDDFGTGYSSLSNLKKFPIDHLKIDQSFVKDISADVDDRDIVATIIMLAHNLHIKTIAEGVETIDHVEFLTKHDCNVLQGYYFSKPLPAQDFENWMNNWKKQ
ncbi:PAS domain S-box-containing protein/diguanylate cyclase (GGDEF) domain-containing protein [Gracilibacillus ureilyticus]|uniref:PAS domain S-box-containing protein/diguanylate cyclase (GGDEF) domain-containing protein n=1 Tax=Gracilibacillus ureilyticus TaxID=531814 RepID=A0A1H9Q9E6_9BACI|nr:bifunctional diguanylate cyclase/phosphodiesterase [Gracilibacillus ureilyticus]SER57060.1 PAS domain S-box-containing protein/diguanylate cyclase (GGDEF) domain-containing protein [Gracilibacillus ureilyticus]